MWITLLSVGLRVLQKIAPLGWDRANYTQIYILRDSGFWQRERGVYSWKTFLNWLQKNCPTGFCHVTKPLTQQCQECQFSYQIHTKTFHFFFYLEGFFIREDSKKAQRSPSCARLSLHHCQHHHDHFHLYSHKSSSFGSSLGVIQTCIYVSHCYASQWPTSESFYSSPVYYIIRSSSQVLYKVWTFSLSFSRLYVLVFNNNILINIMNIWSLSRIRVPSYIFRWLFIRLPLF